MFRDDLPELANLRAGDANLQRPENHDDSFDFEDSRTKRFASTRYFVFKNLRIAAPAKATRGERMNELSFLN